MKRSVGTSEPHEAKSSSACGKLRVQGARE